MENILENLNPAQREAVMNYTGPSLIVAGAGSGKTRVLTSRIAYMISEGNEDGTVKPSSILALTFTNKAATEMRERIEGLIPPMTKRQAHYIWMGTFHSIFLRILRTEAEKIGYPPAFTIYDTTDSQSLIKSICRDMGLAGADKDNDKYKPRAVFAKISRLKNELITPTVYENDPVFAADDAKRGTPRFLEIYKRYVAQCRANGAMDFDDLLVNMVFLLKKNPDVLEKYQHKFEYILVDEYQDTNHVQYLIIKALAALHKNICVVGDDSQSIYSFRGAKIENILGFKRDFPGAAVYKLEQNYRSTKVIVDAANGVISRNASSRELKKECFSAGERGENIKLLKAYTDREEAEMVAGEIRTLGRGGTEWSDIAVLYRVNALSRGIEEALRRREIPYKIYRGHSFFDRKEIKDILAYLRLVVNPRDDEAFKRVVNYPARGIGEVTLGRISAVAREKGASLWEAASGSDDKKIVPFVQLVETLALERTTLSLYEFGREVAIRTGIVGSYKAEGTAEATSALENIDELLSSMIEFTKRTTADALEEGTDPQAAVSLEEWLQSVALMSDMDDEEPENLDRVTLMTVHSAKGLEFRHVFIMGLEEELFPSVREGNFDEIEEERRLFYVALTRAKERSYMSMADQRFIHGNTTFRRPSRFVREIDPRFLDGALDDPRGSFGDGGRFGASKGSFGGRFEDPRGATFGDSGDNNGFRRPAYPSRPDGRGQSGYGYPSREPAAPEKVAPVVPDARFRKITPSYGGERSDGRALGGGVESFVAETGKRDGGISPGIRVCHAKFGRGTVEHVETAAGQTSHAGLNTGADPRRDLKIIVTFDDPTFGRKTLLSKFAKLDIV